jgi:hypothetical protein
MLQVHGAMSTETAQSKLSNNKRQKSPPFSLSSTSQSKNIRFLCRTLYMCCSVRCSNFDCLPLDVVRIRNKISQLWQKKQFTAFNPVLRYPHLHRVFSTIIEYCLRIKSLRATNYYSTCCYAQGYDVGYVCVCLN